jgi:archaemetzincin
VKVILGLMAMTVLAAAAATAGPAPLRVVLVPCGPVPAEVLDSVAKGLRQELGAQVVREKEIAIPASAYSQSRRQYRAEAFLPLLAPQRRGAGDLVLGITGVDLFVSELNFVFGLADPRHRCAVISLVRLDPASYGQRPNRRLSQERALKEAVHELGHLLGLGHCPNPSCIMFFSNRLTDTDRKGPGFCQACARALK